MAGVHFKWDKKVYMPRDRPMRATPAAEAIDNRLPPTPVVSVMVVGDRGDEKGQGAGGPEQGPIA